MKDFIYENYKNPLCWKYSFNFAHRYMYGEVNDQNINIIVLYKNDSDEHCIDIGEYYEYGDNDGYNFCSFGIYMDVYNTIIIDIKNDAYLTFITNLNSSGLGNYTRVEKVDTTYDISDSDLITINNISYSCSTDSDIHFANDDENKKFNIASCINFEL